MKNLLCLMLFVFGAYFSNAQTKKPVSKAPIKKTQVSKTKSTSNFKFGYILEDYILENYTAVKVLDDSIKKASEMYQNGYNKLALEYQTIYLDYESSMKSLDSMTTEKLNVKLKNVQQIKAAAENFQRNAEKEIQKMTGEGIIKIKNDIKAATEKVSAEKGFKYVLTRQKSESLLAGNKMVLYYKDGGLNNLSDAVLLSLGSKPPLKK